MTQWQFMKDKDQRQLILAAALALREAAYLLKELEDTAEKDSVLWQSTRAMRAEISYLIGRVDDLETALR
jgi:hypothetical protein